MRIENDEDKNHAGKAKNKKKISFRRLNSKFGKMKNFLFEGGE